MSTLIMKTTWVKNQRIDKLDSANPVAIEFDRVAAKYETNRLSVWYKAHAKIIMQVLNEPSPGFILDVGCGTGWLLRQIAKSYKHIKGIGIDISPNMIVKAKKAVDLEEIRNLEYIQGNWEDMDLSVLSGKSITTVICANTYHYFADPNTAAKKMFQSLGKGGRLFLLERDKAGSIITQIWDTLHLFLIKDHVRFYCLSELVIFFRNAGFADIKIKKMIRRFFWKKKFFTNIVLLSGHKK
jgi:ubiquinone/menaquinone biosynthesis C-methylase UbiE